MDVETLKLIAEVARARSFSAIARRRRVEPSSVSRTIAVLESELGVRLFQRTTRKLTLTEAGTLYLERIEPLVEQLDEASADVRTAGRGPVGTVRLSASVAFGQICIVPLLAAFRERFPDLTLELLLSDQNVDLIGERIDLAVRLAPTVDANFVVSKLIETRYHVVASPEYLATHPLRQPPDLGSHRALRFTLPGYRDRWLFRDVRGRVVTVPVQGDLLISSALGLRGAALRGLGPALLPDWLIGNDIANGRLVDCFPSHRVTATEFKTGAWLIYPSRNFLANKVRVTIDFLREGLAGLA